MTVGRCTEAPRCNRNIFPMNPELPKKYLQFPSSRSRFYLAKRYAGVLIGLVLFPVYWCLAYTVRTPGLAFRAYCAAMSFRLLLSGRDFEQAYRLLVMPMDSFRYFEFDFLWKALKGFDGKRYLDVSSPRLFPLMLVKRKPGLVADLINPDGKDLSTTIGLAKSLGVSGRCNFHGCLIGDAKFERESFDAITCISVIEHIPDDSGAIRKMWEMLRPGGTLLLTVPCAPRAAEEYSNINEYGVLSLNENGYVFWQRYYDDDLIKDHIYRFTGEPARYAIYGEGQSGVYDRNVLRKRTEPLYPYWREPFMMGREYEYRNRISELPGIGVIALEFVKKAEVNHLIQRPKRQ
jgi:SAM-dependent methyltransferase